jgi:hypothetical protein
MEALLKSQPTELAEYKDILVYAITAMTIVIAAMSVAAIFLLGRKYADHVGEIQFIAAKYNEIERQYGETQLQHRRTTQRLMVGFDRVVRLFVLRTRVDEMNGALQSLRQEGTWLGRIISEPDRPDYEKRLLAHMGACQRQYKARELEILCISSEYAYRGGYLRSLVESVGDEDTLLFLRDYAETVDDRTIKETYMAMLGELTYRLRSSRKEPIFVDSSLWTGRSNNAGAPKKAT